MFTVSSSTGSEDYQNDYGVKWCRLRGSQVKLNIHWVESYVSSKAPNSI